VLIPEPLRESMRASWYVGATLQIKYALVNKMRSHGIESGVHYQTDDPKAELIGMMLERNAAVAGPPDRINRCNGTDCERGGATATALRVERALRRLSAARGRFAQDLPKIALLRVVSPDAAAVYTLVHDREHTNVAAIFREEARLAPDEDRVTILPGVVGGYPNFVFDVAVDDIEPFVDALLALARPADLSAVASRWGVRRSSSRFWSVIDWMQEYLEEQDRREAGLLDWSRYDNL